MLLYGTTGAINDTFIRTAKHKSGVGIGELPVLDEDVHEDLSFTPSSLPWASRIVKSIC